MDIDLIESLLPAVLDAQRKWRERWPAFETHTSLTVDPHRLESALDTLAHRLENNYPFFHPQYIGQMLKPPHPAAVLGYLAAMLINPNNHALDGGPATGQIEKELVKDIAGMFGFGEHLGHLTSSGTIANLEALWVARELNPGSSIAVSDQAHYTHKRMCRVLGMRCMEVTADTRGVMDLDALRRLCMSENIGTVVATLGTTGFGALDQLDELVAMKKEFGFRIHADGAYGGFFVLIAETGDVNAGVYGAVKDVDSIVVDPHKHGLQPFGCGCVLFSDPSVGMLYKHDSPYTYFTSNDLHLGEISLECSRPGASAAALWLTLQCLPLKSGEGLGPVLRACRKSAVDASFSIRTSECLSLLLDPELDIVVYYPCQAGMSASAISAASDRMFDDLEHDPETPLYVGKFRVPTSMLKSRHSEVAADREWTTVLRSVLMKPETGDHLSTIITTLERNAPRS
jgi:glutamate/tyrosine decarboxylase-like PLP-dependent enzyme